MSQDHTKDLYTVIPVQDLWPEGDALQLYNNKINNNSGGSS